MNEKTQTAVRPEEFAAKLAQFSLACVAGWIVAVVLYHIVGWFSGPPSHETSAMAKVINDTFEHLRNSLYR